MMSASGFKPASSIDIASQALPSDSIHPAAIRAVTATPDALPLQAAIKETPPVRR